MQNAGESAAGIVAFTEQSLDRFYFSFDQVTAFNADRNVNYGIHSCFQLHEEEKKMLQGHHDHSGARPS